MSEHTGTHIALRTRPLRCGSLMRSAWKTISLQASAPSTTPRAWSFDGNQGLSVRSPSTRSITPGRKNEPSGSAEMGWPASRSIAILSAWASRMSLGIGFFCSISWKGNLRHLNGGCGCEYAHDCRIPWAAIGTRTTRGDCCLGADHGSLTPTTPDSWGPRLNSRAATTSRTQ